MRRTRALLLAGMLTGSLLIILPAAATAARLGSFSVRPAEFNAADPVTRAYFKLHLGSGHAYSGNVVVHNSASTPVTLYVYPVDGLTGVTSGAVYGNHSDHLRGAGRWLTPGASEITMRPHSQRLVPFTVHVPASTSAGDHLAGLAVEDAAPSHIPGRFSIVEIFRVVIGVEIKVPGTAGRDIQLTGLGLHALPGTRNATIVVHMRNAGGLMCKPVLSIGLRGATGRSIVTRTLDTVLPGDSIAYPFIWPTAVSTGDYTASVHATGCGRAASLQSALRAGRPLIGNTEPAHAAAAPAPPPRTVQTIDWRLLAIVALGCMFCGSLVHSFVVARGRRTTRRRPRKGGIVLRPVDAGAGITLRPVDRQDRS